jgi:hypothetical protein
MAGKLAGKRLDYKYLVAISRSGYASDHASSLNAQEDDVVLPHQKVAAEVRAEMARQQLSGVRAAHALGWTQNYISRRLSGTVPFDVADLGALADLLEVPVGVFFEGPERGKMILGVRTTPSRPPASLAAAA